MTKKEDILHALTRNKNFLYSKYPIKSLAVFGPVARDEYNENSDVDLLIEFSDSIGIRFIDLAEEIESLLNQRVDLVSKKAVKPKYFKAFEEELIYV